MYRILNIRVKCHPKILKYAKFIFYNVKPVRRLKRLSVYLLLIKYNSYVNIKVVRPLLQMKMADFVKHFMNKTFARKVRKISHLLLRGFTLKHELTFITV